MTLVAQVAYGGQLYVWASVIAALFMMVALSEFGTGSAVCLQCQGKGAHRDDCPFNDKNRSK